MRSGRFRVRTATSPRLLSISTWDTGPPGVGRTARGRAGSRAALRIDRARGRGRLTRMIKLVFCCRRRPELGREEFQRYWLERHGPLVRSLRAALPMRRYVQSHTLETP